MFNVDSDVFCAVVEEMLEDIEVNDDSVAAVASKTSCVETSFFFADRSRYHTGGQELSVPFTSEGNLTGFHSDGGARLLIDGSK